MATSQDTEITLGTGKMLMLFFGLVTLCAVFFGAGFSVGRNSQRTATLADASPSATATQLSRQPTSGSTAAAAPDSPASGKPVVEKDSTVPAGAADSHTAQSPPLLEVAGKGTPLDPLASPSASGYYVQVAAVSKQDDADALVAALKKKQYSAFAASNSPVDKLFHVQVGPFFDVKDAEATRAKLISDGYNPILKK